MRRGLVPLAVLLFVAAPAAAKVTVYPVPTAGSSPFAILTAFDNAAWFTESGADKIGHVDQAGAITEFALPAGANPLGFSATAVGTFAIAAHGSGAIDEMSPAGKVTVHPLADGRLPYDVTTGPADGETWFTAQPPTAGGGLTQGAIEKLDLQGTITAYPLTGAAITVPWAITPGPDGNLWFTEQRTASEDGFIGRITRDGTITEFSAGPGSIPTDITQGGDGNMWFTDQNHGKVGRITMAGKITEFSIGASSEILGIDRNPAGAVIAADPFGHALYTVDPSGRARKIAVPGSPRFLGLRYPSGEWFTLADGRIGWVGDDELTAACRPPKLVGRTLAKARTLLAAADCKLGRVTRRRGRRGVVLAQSPKSGRYAPGYAVAVTVGR